MVGRLAMRVWKIGPGLRYGGILCFVRVHMFVVPAIFPVCA